MKNSFDKNNIPEFIKKLKIKELEKIQQEILYLYNKIMAISSLLQQQYVKPKKLTNILEICRDLIVKCDNLKQTIFKCENEEECLSLYLTTVKEIIEEFERKIVANTCNFYNKKLLFHYQKSFNIFLIETKMKDIINYIVAKLYEGIK